MMNIQTKLFSAAALAAIVVAPALLLAQEVPSDGARMESHFAAADADADGLLSLDEFLTAHGERVASLDADADGLLSRDELASFEGRAGRTQPARAIERRMERLDIDGDGTVSLEEFESAHALRFESGDGDGDGFLSIEEAREARPGRRDRHGGAERRGELRALDTDGDREISREEAEAGGLDFARMDRNGDGVLNANDRQRRRCECADE